jgi:hypothetical protein
VKETMAMMRAYVQLVSSHWSPHWRMFRRWVIFKVYAEHLVKTYQDKTFTPSLKNATQIVTDENAAFEELDTLMNLFRHLFTVITPYLKPTEQTEHGLSLARTMIESHDIIGWGEINHIRRVLQVSP